MSNFLPIQAFVNLNFTAPLSLAINRVIYFETLPAAKMRHSLPLKDIALGATVVI